MATSVIPAMTSSFESKDVVLVAGPFMVSFRVQRK